MNEFIHITEGIGLAAAAGMRPFLPALLAGALAGQKVVLGFKHTSYSFLQSGVFLLVISILFVVAWLLQRRLGAQRFEAGPAGAAVGGIGIGIGALLFAAVLAQHHDPAWIGLLAGLSVALLAQLAVRPLLARTRARLEDPQAREALALYADAASLALAAVAIFLGPLSLVAVLLLARLLLAARRRAGEKYAGLRILR